MTQPIILMLGNCQENYLPETLSSNWEYSGLVFQLEALTDNMCLLFPFFIPDTSSLYMTVCMFGYSAVLACETNSADLHVFDIQHLKNQ